MTTTTAIRFLKTTPMHAGKKAYPFPTHGERGLRVSTCRGQVYLCIEEVQHIPT